MVNSKFELEEKIDLQQQTITSLEMELQKVTDEAELRKTVEEQLSKNLLKHENDSMQMAEKLTVMKNQMLEYDRFMGMNRKYGAVRIQTIKNTPVTFQFL